MDNKAVAVKDLQWSPDKGTFHFGPVSIAASRGRFIALVGPNGAGKSTLLNLIGGILKAKQGRVEVFGKPPGEWKPRERGMKMAFLSQDPERPFGFPVRDYVAMGRFPKNGPFRDISRNDRELIDSELNAWGISKLADRSVTSLSGGEFQRVRLARSFCQEPGLLLLDEPGNHLDLSSRMAILERLKRDASNGRCIIAVLHDVNDALLYSDEVWLMDKGIVISHGKPAEVLDTERLADVYGLKLSRFRNDEGLEMMGVPSGINKSLPG